MDSSRRRPDRSRPLEFVLGKRRPAIASSPDLGVREEKAAVRRAARADRDALQSGLGAAAATALVARFFHTPALRALASPSTVVAGYMPIGSEIDCLPLLHRLDAAGVALCLPVVAARDAPLVFRRWSPGDKLATGPMGISEPAAAAPEVMPQVLLVPLLAFDRQGHRLGYGGGYYDRTLKQLRARGNDDEGGIVAIGVAFAGQLRDKVPVAVNDQRLDWILTEAGAEHVAGAPARSRAE